MGYRDAAPDGRKDKEGHSILVLPQGTSLAGKYQVSYLGVGGMSIVYKGNREGKIYFIKEVDAHNSQHVISLSQEKFMLERLSHPGIVKIHDFFEQEGFWYLVSDFIEGKSLNRLISPLPDIFIQEKIVLDWARQLYDIFEYLHSQKPPIIYRDLKPQNVIRDNEGKIHLVDFGIARTYKEDSIGDTTPMGSFLTASPEHYGGKQTDERSDIYTVGATLHYLLTNGKGRGTDLFDFSPPRNINSKISEKTEKVIMKALSPEPDKRFPTIEEMKKAQFNSVSSESTKAVPAIAEDEETSKMTRSGRLAREGASGKSEKTGPADSENVIQSFISFALSQPRLIAVFLAVIVLVTFTAVIIRGSAKQKIAAIQSPEVTNSPESAAVVNIDTSPEPGASPSASPLVPEPGFSLVIGTSTPTAKPTPTVVAVTPATAPTVASQPAYPMGTADPRQHRTQTTNSAPTPEQPKQPAAANPQYTPSSKEEEILAEYFPSYKKNIKLFTRKDHVFISKKNDYSVSIPPGYYVIDEDNFITFAAVDERKGPISIRILQISTMPIPKGDFNTKEVFLTYLYSRMSENGEEMLEGEQLYRMGSETRTYDGYFVVVKGNAPSPLNNKFTTPFLKKMCYITAGSVRETIYCFKASAPEETYNKFKDSEFKVFLESVNFTAQ